MHRYYTFSCQKPIHDRKTILQFEVYPISGSMEVMLDRRLVQDDWRGLGMGVMDNVITPSSFVLLLETRNTPWKPQVTIATTYFTCMHRNQLI